VRANAADKFHWTVDAGHIPDAKASGSIAYRGGRIGVTAVPEETKIHPCGVTA
jgi:hypothetical protein